MKTRIQKQYTSLNNKEQFKYRIDVNRTGKWQPLRINGAMKLFDHINHAKNYELIMQKR